MSFTCLPGYGNTSSSPSSSSTPVRTVRLWSSSSRGWQGGDHSGGLLLLRQSSSYISSGPTPSLHLCPRYGILSKCRLTEKVQIYVWILCFSVESLSSWTCAALIQQQGEWWADFRWYCVDLFTLFFSILNFPVNEASSEELSDRKNVTELLGFLKFPKDLNKHTAVTLLSGNKRGNKGVY